MNRTTPQLAPAFVLAAIWAGCGPSRVDADKSEADIRDDLRAQTQLSVESMTCPRDIPCRSGESFRCTATAEGGEIVVQVSQRSDNCGIRWAIERGTVSSVRLEDQIQHAFYERTAADAFVDCGRPYRVAVPGATFECSIENRLGKQAAIAAHIDDERGNVSWRLRAPNAR